MKKRLMAPEEPKSTSKNWITFESNVNVPMLSLRRWVTVLVVAGFGKTESFRPFSRDAIKPVKVKNRACYPVLRSSPPPVGDLTLDNLIDLPCLMSSCTSALAWTIPIWEVTKGQLLDTGVAKSWAGLTAETFSLASRESAALTLIWRAMMGQRSARDSRAAPVLLRAGLGADLR